MRDTSTALPTIAATCLVALLFLACAESPDEVYQRALDARTAKDSAAYLSCFTARTRRLLERLDEVEEMTRQKLTYLQNPFSLLPDGGQRGSAKEKGNVARFVVTGGREDIEVVMLKEQGEWRIEALELEAFWGPMMNSAEVE